MCEVRVLRWRFSLSVAQKRSDVQIAFFPDQAKELLSVFSVLHEDLLKSELVCSL